MTEGGSRNDGSGCRPSASRWSIGARIGVFLSLLAVSAGMFFVDWPRTLEAFRNVDGIGVVIATILFAMSFPVLALRNRGLLAVANPPGVAPLFRYLMIGYLTNAILPARPGDAVRVALLNRRSRVGLTVGLAGLALERFFDVAVIASFGLLLSLVVDLPQAILRALQFIALATFVMFMLACLLSRRTGWLRSLPSRHPRFLSGRMARFVIERSAVFAGATGLVASPFCFAKAAILTILGWLPQVVGVVVLLHSFHLDVPPAAGFLVIVTTNLGAAIPSSPGNVGIYHSLAILALSVWNISTETALAFAICAHSIAIALHIGLGLVCALLEGVSVAQLGDLSKSFAAEPKSDSAAAPELKISATNAAAG